MVNEHPEGKVCPLRMFQFMQDQGCIGDKCMWIWKCREPKPDSYYIELPSWIHQKPNDTSENHEECHCGFPHNYSEEGFS